MPHLEDVGFHLRHVYRVGALSLARLAGQAKLHRVHDALIRQAILTKLSSHGESQDVGPAAGTGVLIFCRHVAGAHGPLANLSASAHAIALLNGQAETAMLVVAKIALHLGQSQFVVRRAVTKVLVHARRINNLARIHQIVRVEERLDVTKSLIQRVAKEALDVLAAHKAVAVLAGPRSAVADDHLECGVGNCLHLQTIFFLMQVEHRLGVQHTDRSMAADRHTYAVLRADLAQTLHVLSQVLDRDAGIVDKVERFLTPADIGLQANAQSAKLPNLGDVLWLIPDDMRSADPPALHILGKGVA